MRIIESNDEIRCPIATKGLYEVIDPEINLNIVDLGLVYRIMFYDDRNEVAVTMTLTTRFCPMGDAIVDSTKASLKNSFPELNNRVDLTFDPPWDTAMISDEGNTFLNG